MRGARAQPSATPPKTGSEREGSTKAQDSSASPSVVREIQVMRARDNLPLFPRRYQFLSASRGGLYPANSMACGQRARIQAADGVVSSLIPGEMGFPRRKSAAESRF